MPVKRGKDSKGSYYKYDSKTGKKYHYKEGDKDSRERAKKKARDQEKAAHANKDK